MKSEQNSGFNKYMNNLRAKKILEYATGKICLEVGCGEGQITKHLTKVIPTVVALDKDKGQLKKVSNKKGIIKIHCLIEELKTQNKFDFIVCSNVLEHLDNTGAVLNKVRDLCHKDTILFFSVPNACSINRIVGHDCGMLSDLFDLSKCDIKAGHKRMYSVLGLRRQISYFFEIIKVGTFFCKPLNNEKMKYFPKEILKMLEELPMGDMGAEIFCVCKLK